MAARGDTLIVHLFGRASLRLVMFVGGGLAWFAPSGALSHGWLGRSVGRGMGGY
jgi:hypothetical protein